MPVGERGPGSHDLWRLTTGLTREESHWGTEGREFKSPQPDKQCAGQAVFLESAVWPVVALGA